MTVVNYSAAEKLLRILDELIAEALRVHTMAQELQELTLTKIKRDDDAGTV